MALPSSRLTSILKGRTHTVSANPTLRRIKGALRAPICDPWIRLRRSANPDFEALSETPQSRCSG